MRHGHNAHKKKGDQIKALKGTAVGGVVDTCKEKGWVLLRGVLFHTDTSFSTVADQSVLERWEKGDHGHTESTDADRHRLPLWQIQRPILKEI